ncbi:uncharacterized protein K489DRAFT_304546, partial [Dissoconium aciculare CBS 342.82]|uniref:TECPR1-like DysF domain-containing protein n=1 Tax=Dissoconium aciculare CBS 342.82 TaxID=1314786 RepID=A0A6J3M9K4_9PEZI
DDDAASVTTQDTTMSGRGKWRQRANRLRDSMVGSYSRDPSVMSGASSDRRTSIQDRLLTQVMSQILPAMPIDEGDEGDDDESPANPSLGGNKKKVQPSTDGSGGRPEFNLATMAVNFRLFNARIGVVFVFQDMMIRLFTWHHPTHTLSFLAAHTLLCLQPHLIPVIPPLACFLFAIMLPNFVSRHPTPTNDPRMGPSFAGPATAPATRIKPAPEVSRDFWHNMRDLQNSMRDFSAGHDAAATAITPLVNFGDERLSSSLFIAGLTLGAAALLGTWVVPYHLVALVGGWAAVLSAHPEVQKALQTSNAFDGLQGHLDTGLARLRAWIDADISLDAAPEARQVEIFELQKFQPGSATWEAWLFCATPWDPHSPERRVAPAPGSGGGGGVVADTSSRRPKGTAFFEEVLPPAGWTWAEKKWALDLFSREWVEQRLIADVAVEEAGERWVYDLAAEDPSEAAKTASLLDSLRKGAGVSGENRMAQRRDFGSVVGPERFGMWRRRRWTRLVERR